MQRRRPVSALQGWRRSRRSGEVSEECPGDESRAPGVRLCWNRRTSSSSLPARKEVGRG